jgi:ZIP family zinc transporter
LKEVIWSILLPFVGTVLGSMCVFLIKDKMNDNIKKASSGFAAGVMVAASIWSLIIPSMDAASHLGKFSFVPSLVGIWIGFAFLMVLDKIIPHIHTGNGEKEGPDCNFHKSTMMIFAVALHNLPEGMAVGVVLASALSGGNGVSLIGALALAVGIAIQNFPEGAIVSIPVKQMGIKKGKAFLIGALSGVVEPMGAILTILLASVVVPMLPYFLSFAAGAMLYVVVEELIPEMTEGKHSHIGTIFFAVGFTVMMVLDVIFA